MPIRDESPWAICTIFDAG